MRKARHLAPLRQFFQPEGISFLGPFYGHFQLLAQHIRRSTVIQVRVRENHFFHHGVHFFDGLHDPFDVATRVDNRGLTRGLALDNGTVLLEGGDGHYGALYRHI